MDNIVFADGTSGETSSNTHPFSLTTGQHDDDNDIAPEEKA